MLTLPITHISKRDIIARSTTTVTKSGVLISKFSNLPKRKAEHLFIFTMMINALARRTVARRSAVAASLRTFSTHPQQRQPSGASTQIPTKLQAWMDDMEDYDSRIHYYAYQQPQPSDAKRQIPTKLQAWMDDMEDYDSWIHYYAYQQPQKNSKPTMNSVVEGINRHELDHQSRQILKQHLEDAFLRRHAWK